VELKIIISDNKLWETQGFYQVGQWSGESEQKKRKSGGKLKKTKIKTCDEKEAVMESMSGPRGVGSRWGRCWVIGLAWGVGQKSDLLKQVKKLIKKEIRVQGEGGLPGE